MQRGFSLVELSIVLVILGLLTGGILAGQSLIRASELRAVSTEYQRYAAAVQTFRDKYFAIPGDFNGATRFWNRLNTNADCVSTHGLGVAGSPGACDGGGDGSINSAGGAGQSGDMHQFWRHLALSGLIEGSYSGLAGSGGGQHVEFSSNNAPRSKLSNAGYGAMWLGVQDGTNSPFAGSYGNTLYLGGQHTSNVANVGVLKAEEAWNIDTKMDDGLPAIGKIRTLKSSFRLNCTTTDVPSTSVYDLVQTALGCPLLLTNL
ncbi:MAG: type II secretion system protein [Alphaproteobacteria bacterium]|nr:type II secretion system protein [Alphaproteobacteria bacterium]